MRWRMAQGEDCALRTLGCRWNGRHCFLRLTMAHFGECPICAKSCLSGRKPTWISIDCPHEEDRLSLVRALDALVAITDALGRRDTPAIHRLGRCRRGIGRGRSLFSGPSLRAPTRLAFSLLAAVGAKTSRIEIGTAVIDMRYENPLYMAEDAGAADLISGSRLQLGLSR